MSHSVHAEHSHQHHAGCGHTRILHDGHVDFLHDGHLHSPHDGHYDEHIIAVSSTNPDVCDLVACSCDHEGCGHQKVPHGDHFDFLVDGRLHHKHGDHCDDHGPVTVVV